MAAIRRLVLDILKPSEVPTIAFARGVSDLTGVDATTARLVETDREVQNIVLVVEGADVDDDAVVDCLEDLGGTLHSVDEVVCGEHTPVSHEASADATWLR
ncbi:DUF211 domain-containing protein [Salinigranum halophilum]|jgi:hypothetical protein|uniref:DUF211 domain-containing protein n=1 Tax=Salinigranum halophilum TaxID=2565931 RepID=UPI0010A809C9|nr:DUF211 domain-containing protein [Salinigranum halophilum]